MQSWGGFILGQESIAQVNAKKDAFRLLRLRNPKLMANSRYLLIFSFSPEDGRACP